MHHNWLCICYLQQLTNCFQSLPHSKYLLFLRQHKFQDIVFAIDNSLDMLNILNQNAFVFDFIEII